MKRTELRRGGHLTRTGFLPRGAAGLERRTPIAPRRAKPRARVDLPDGIGEGIARKLVSLRSGGWCEMRVFGYCLGGATNWCHRKAKGQGGLWQASNGVAGCGSGSRGCHGWCHSYPAEARQLGWMLLSTEDPAEVPMRLHDGRTVWLNDKGLYLPKRGGT